MEESTETLLQNDEILENTEDNASELYETLESIASSPFNLNTASREDFERLYILSPIQIQDIIDYRTKNHEFKSIFELASVKSINLELAQKIEAYFFVAPVDFFDTIQIKNLYNKGKIKLLFLTVSNIEAKEGFKSIYDTTDMGFIGSPLKYLAKYRFNRRDKIEAGLTFEKDAGEKFLSNNNLEFLSGFVAVNQFKMFKKIVLGDFMANFGEGLVVWNGFSMGKSSIIGSVSKVNQGINQYTSSSENNYLRGLAITTFHKEFSFSLFISYKALDANLKLDSTTNDSYFNSLNVSGIHNTLSSLSNKGSIDEFTSGYNITGKIKNFTFGNTGALSIFSQNFQKSDDAYNNLVFRGQKSSATGVYCRFIYRSFLLSGEQAFSQQGGLASTVNMAIDIVDNLKLALQSRYFNPQYYSRYNRPFAENSTATNEFGVFSGIEYTPISKLSIKAYSDLFMFPWIKYRVNSPSRGHEYFVQTDYQVNSSLGLYLRFKTKTKERNQSNSGTMYSIQEVSNTKYRLGLQYKVSNFICMKNIIETSLYRSDSEQSKGFFIAHDVAVGTLNNKLKLEARYSIFDTDDFLSAIYSFENNISNSFSFPALSGKGIRTYIMAKANMSKNIGLGIRYSLTQYADRNIIGEGLNQIKGNRQSDIVFRLTVEF